ncbi:putative TIM-barrel fold metal-dependent hydrolase [Paucibacter oligotrophus]|uniref:Putative TIM-barrel fold metal-dependent hydrolase n=1 Tax=Roseateles oligotrophus TaxID=1769250 RepID=A0A840LI03_9BURK|nr:amidohydrolase family protein [Roseateles oligotrophus]MBB4846233.1 putative TIM-barrel fold metal-dependent hydrolase [Roseateles oligotrophus]
MNPTRIIDAHHHIWRKQDVPWLADEPRPRIFGPYEGIRRDYLATEYMEDLASWRVEKSVYVQCNWDPKRAVEETRWVQKVADEVGFPHGIVAYADLRRPDVDAQLDAHAACANLCGIRQQIHWHENPHWAYVEQADLFNTPQWQDGLRKVAARGLAFDLQIFPSQMKAICAVVEKFPDLPFVLNHAGMLNDRSELGLARWRDGMRHLAQQPHVVVKFSGLNTFEHRCAADLMRPIVQESLEQFGAQRCMYGSNFPIEKLWTTYQGYVADLIEAIGVVTQEELDAIFFSTAARIYKL